MSILYGTLTYQEICEMNKCLYQEAEFNFLMYQYLKTKPGHGELASKYRDNLQAIRSHINKNLEQMEILWMNQEKRDKLFKAEREIKI